MSSEVLFHQLLFLLLDYFHGYFQGYFQDHRELGKESHEYCCKIIIFKKKLILQTCSYLMALCTRVTRFSLFPSSKLLLIYARLSAIASTATTSLPMAATIMVYMPMLDPAYKTVRIEQQFEC